MTLCVRAFARARSVEPPLLRAASPSPSPPPHTHTHTHATATTAFVPARLALTAAPAAPLEQACDIKDPGKHITWTPPEGGGGPGYQVM